MSLVVAVLAATYGCSGVEDDTFVAGFGKAVWDRYENKSADPIDLSEFTEFEWDSFHPVKNSGAFDWILLRQIWLPALKHMFYMEEWNTWAFKKHGIVVRYAAVQTVERPVADHHEFLVAPLMAEPIDRDDAQFVLVRMQHPRKVEYRLVPAGELEVTNQSSVQ